MLKAPSNLESLPQELKDLVVDHIYQIPDEDERLRALCATALVSRRFRYWAHKRLFATVVLRGKYGKPPAAIIRRIWQLRDLIDADPQSEKTGVASHIRSFTLSLGGHRASVVPPLEDNSLPAILQKIHHTGSRPRSLSILLFMPGDNDQLDWTSLHQDFRLALVNACHSALLTTLRLRGFKNLPHDILAGSSIDNIKFNNLSVKHYSKDETGGISPRLGACPQSQWISNDIVFPQELPLLLNSGDDPEVKINEVSPSMTNDPSSPMSNSSIQSQSSSISDPAIMGVRLYPDCIHLESIETDHSFPIFHLLDLTPTRSCSPEYILRKLRNLTMNIADMDGFKKTSEIFTNASSVEKLELKLNCTVFPKDALSLRPLCRLKHLRLIHRVPTLATGNRFTNHAPHSTVQDMVNLLTHSELPKSLRRISITLCLKLPYGPYYLLLSHEEDDNVASTASGTNNVSTNEAVNEGHGSISTHLDTTDPAGATTSTPYGLKTITNNNSFPVNRIFSHYSNGFKLIDDVLGYPLSPTSAENPDRFADINYYTVRLEIDLYMVPKDFTKQKAKEFSDEAADYLKSTFFPKLNERFDRVDEINSERRGGGFGVVVTPKFRSC